jgi:predicted transcriptional regulator
MAEGREPVRDSAGERHTQSADNRGGAVKVVVAALRLLCYICAYHKMRESKTMAATTTIRLPPKLRARLGALAKQTGRSAHSLIVEAVERHAAYEEQMRSLVKEALAADADIEKTGEVYRAEDVHAWMRRLALGESVARPRPWRR